MAPGEPGIVFMSWAVGWRRGCECELCSLFVWGLDVCAGTCTERPTLAEKQGLRESCAVLTIELVLIIL